MKPSNHNRHQIRQGFTRPHRLAFSVVKGSAGFTLVEAFVAITILLVTIVGPMTIAARGLQSAFFARDQLTAFYLGQEAIETVRFWRDTYALGGSSFFDAGNMPAACQLTNAAGCSIEVRNLVPFSYVDCSSPSDACRVQYDDATLGSERGFYTHETGSNTKFTRRMWIEPVNGQEAEITVEVSWQSGLFSSARTVVVQSRILDVYQE